MYSFFDTLFTLELLTYGAICKKYNISLDDIKLLIFFKEELKQEN